MRNPRDLVTRDEFGDTLGKLSGPWAHEPDVLHRKTFANSA